MNTARVFLLAATAAVTAFLSLPSSPALAVGYTVDTTSDSAALTACAAAAADCSLRGAIADANASAVADTIFFDATVFPTATPATISIAVNGALPTLTGGNDTIDATNRGVIVQGAEARTFSCLVISSSGNTIKGLQVTDCNSAIVVSNGTNNTIGPGNTLFDSANGVSVAQGSAGSNLIIGNKSGTNTAGTAIHPDGGNDTGVMIQGPNNTVGGTSPAARNIISGNASGIQILSVSANLASGNLVKGNFIGTDVTGTVDLGNTNLGVAVSGAPSNIIGGTIPGEGNLISGNTSRNVLLFTSATNTTVSGNIIGPDINGSGAAMTSGNGVEVFGGAGNIIGPRNVISDNTTGVNITSPGTDGNVVQGNLIGTNISGTAGVPNSSQGVLIQNGARFNTVGGTARGAGNIIAFNSGQGVGVQDSATTGNSIRANSIHDNTGLEIALLIGGNLGLAAPTLTAGSATASSVGGTACPNCTVDVFSTGSGSDPRIYESSATANAGGAFTFTGALLNGPSLVATQTDTFGNTSQVSSAIAAEMCNSTDDDADGFTDEGYSDTDGDGRKDCVDTGQTCFDPAGTLSCLPTDCVTLAEDLDAFHDTDGCPEPDNDNDGHPDVGDTCPGTDSQTGPDGILGSPQDLNHNGVQDPGAPWNEAPLTTDDVPPFVFEDWDGVLDGDGCHDSPGDDFDGDGFSDDLEVLHLGTDAGRGCPQTSRVNDETPDPWPPDADDDQDVDIGDVTLLFGDPDGDGVSIIQEPANYTPRSDFDADGDVDIGDVIIGLAVRILTRCN